jgi:hypothetical protein
MKFAGCFWRVATVAFISLIGSLAVAEPAKAPDRPRLAVLVIFDQLRGDYLTRWEKLFGAEGFRRLQKEGAWFQNCHYPYAVTVTAAGHASVATGCSPDRHGIVGNEWFDRSTRSEVGCVSTDRYETVPSSPARPNKNASKQLSEGVSPERLLKPTLGDALKEATGGKGRVVSLSFKDRSAVLPAGQRPDACYWLHLGTGQFVTSSYYRDRIHRWVEEYNRGHPADRWFGKNWNRLRPELDYERYSGPDDVAAETTGVFEGRTFPHPLAGGPNGLKTAYYGALYVSPFGNDLLLGLAERAIDGEQLGCREVPDLLCLSFSSNDAIGHAYGPDSQEVLDVTLRSDLIVKELLDFLDAKVGKGRYVLALTADHGVCPLPEVSRQQGRDAGRVPAAPLLRGAEEFLSKTCGTANAKARWIEAYSPPWLYLNQDLIRRRGLEASEVESALAGWLAKQPGFQAAYTRTQLLRGVDEHDAIGESVRRSFYPARSGDVIGILKPYYLLSAQFSAGTNHGTPHAYDTHVPLLAMGPGIRPGVRQEAVSPLATAAILAHALGIAPPAGADTDVPDQLLTLKAR